MVRYEVVGVLGRGAMAVVELAVAPDGTRVARKRLPLGGSAHEIDLARRRLRRESEILRSLRHPSIVPVLDVEDDGTDVVIVMPALACSLADRVAADGPLRPADLVRTGRLLLEGLAAAHRGGVVHRDIKPGNVLFDETGRPALADFGVALSRDLTAGLTQVGTVIGTASWMAPEQARGEHAGPASDVWSLAATLVFAVTGEGPWGSGPAEAVLARAARGQVPPLPDDLPEVLRAPLAAMLDPVPERRPSAAAVLGGFDGTAVSRAAGGPASPARRAKGRGRLSRLLLGADGPRPRSTRRTVLATAGGAAVLALVAALALWATTGGGPRRTSAAGTGTRAAPACHPLEYQACGQPAAAHSDGSSCLPGWYDLDGLPADGCEAHSDYTPGTVLTSAAVLRANLVPAGAVDSFTTRVDGHVLSFCSDTLQLHLTAPEGVADRLQVWHGGTLVTSATSVAGQPAVATVDKPGCFGSHSETLTLRVSGVVGATASDFVLSRSGGW